MGCGALSIALSGMGNKFTALCLPPEHSYQSCPTRKFEQRKLNSHGTHPTAPFKKEAKHAALSNWWAYPVVIYNWGAWTVTLVALEPSLRTCMIAEHSLQPCPCSKPSQWPAQLQSIACGFTWPGSLTATLWKQSNVSIPTPLQIQLDTSFTWKDWEVTLSNSEA